MSVDTDIPASTDLFGKTISDLQNNVVIGENSISGTLHYINDYTGFSGDPSLQSGNYLVIHATSQVEGATITVKVTNPVTLDDDGIAVLRIADKATQTVTITASADGYTSVSKVYTLNGLTCETEA